MLPSASTETPTPSTFETVLHVLVQALSTRALLLLALMGAFVLSVMAMSNQTTMALAVLIAYAALTVLPVTFLEVWRRA